jgi:hypothetical protein
LSVKQAAEHYSALLSPELYHLLTVERRWTTRRYASWVTDLLEVTGIAYTAADDAAAAAAADLPPRRPAAVCGAQRRSRGGVLSRGPLTREDSDDIAAWAHECYAREGLGLLAVERRQDGACLGMCGLHHQESYPDDVEVAWRLAPEHWGQGYATEAATGCWTTGSGRSTCRG